MKLLEEVNKGHQNLGASLVSGKIVVSGATVLAKYRKRNDNRKLSSQRYKAEIDQSTLNDQTLELYKIFLPLCSNNFEYLACGYTEEYFNTEERSPMFT